MPYPATICWFEPVIKAARQNRRNKIYLATTTVFADTETLQTAADSFSGALGPKITAIISDQCAYLGGSLRYIGGGHDLEVFSSEGADDGDRSGDTMPDEVCAVIQKRTGQSGRDKRGRYFFSGLAEDGVAAGVVSPGGVLEAPLQDLASFLGADYVDGGLTFHQRHYDRKTNSLLVVTQCRPLAVLGTRKDRRQPLQLSNSYF